MDLQTQTDPQLNNVEAIVQDVSNLQVTHVVPADITCQGLESQVNNESRPCLAIVLYCFYRYRYCRFNCEPMGSITGLFA